MNLLNISSRNVWRNKVRSLLCILAVAAACTFLIFLMSFQKGSYQMMINNAVHARTGHLQIQAEGYQEDRDLALEIDDPEAVIGLLDGVDGIEGFAARASAPALVSVGDRTQGAWLWGIEPSRETNVSTLGSVVRQGAFLSEDDTTGALVAEALATNLNISIGDEVVFLGQGADGSMAAGRLTVRGIIKLGISELDRIVIVTHIAMLQDAYSMRGGVSEVAVLLDGDARRPAAIEEISSRISASGIEGLAVLGWPELLPEVEQSIRMDWTSGLIMYAVLVLIVGFGIANTFLMAFMDRIHEYGVLLALGMDALRLSIMAYLESMILMLIGLVLGMAAGTGVAIYFTRNGIRMPGEEIYAEYGMDPVICSYLTPDVLYWAAGFVTVITAIMAIYPAWKAGQLRPVEAMRR